MRFEDTSDADALEASSPAARRDSLTRRVSLLLRSLTHLSQTVRPSGVTEEPRVSGVVACFAIQMSLTAVLWNRYVDQFQSLLESPPASHLQAVSEAS